MKGSFGLVPAALVVVCGLSAGVRGQTQAYQPGSGITNPQIIRQPEPEYTSAALRQKIQGDVELQAIVMPDGTVGEVKVLKSLDSTYGLDQAAIDAAKKWLFKPGMKDGQPVPVVVNLVLTFRAGGKQAAPPAPQPQPSPSSAWAQGQFTNANFPNASAQDLENARQLYALLTGRQAAQQAPQVEKAQDDFEKGTFSESTPDLVKPRVLTQKAPKYTSDGMRAKIQGDVLLDAIVETDGTVSRVRIARSLDAQYGLDDEAMNAVRQWTFEPGTLKGQKVPVLVHLTVTFRLH